MNTWRNRCLEMYEAAVSVSNNYFLLVNGPDNNEVFRTMIKKWQNTTKQLLEILDNNLDNDSDYEQIQAIEGIFGDIILSPLQILWEATTERLATINRINIKDALDAIQIEYLERGAKRDPIECARYIIECINNQFTTLKHLTGYEYPKFENV